MKVSKIFFHSILETFHIRTMTFRHGCLGTRTFRHLELLGTRGEKFFFQNWKNFISKSIFSKKNLFWKKKFFVWNKKSFSNKKVSFWLKVDILEAFHMTLVKKDYCQDRDRKKRSGYRKKPSSDSQEKSAIFKLYTNCFCRQRVGLEAEEESSRTHFQVLGLEPSSPQKLPCPRLEDSTTFWTIENARNLEENLWRPCLFSAIGDHLKMLLLLLLMGNGASKSATVR